MVRRMKIALALAVTLAAACGGSAAKTDAGSGNDSAADTGAVDTGGACDPAAQNCGAGMKCDFGCQGTTAIVAC